MLKSSNPFNSRKLGVKTIKS